MERTKKILALAALAVLVVAAAPRVVAQTSTIKIGVFDPIRITEETAEGKKTQDELSSYFDQKQKELSGKQAEIQQLQQQLQQQQLSLSADKRSSMELDIQRRLLELNTTKEMATQEYQLRVQAAEASFNEKLRAVLDQFAKAEKFDIILDRGSVAWSAPTIDVTTAVTERFNAMFPPAEAAAGE